MEDFKTFVANNGEGGATISADELNRIIARREWFSLARIIREHITGKPDGAVKILSAAGRISSLKRARVDISKLRPAAKAEEESADDIIEKFLQAGDYRIVAGEEGDETLADVRTEAEFTDEEDIVSEELAEIYLSQGLKSEALAIYRKLSLRNTEKSVYFAEIIDRIENNN